MGDASLASELVLFLRTEKKWWLAPFLSALVVLSGAVVFAEGSAFAPFLYTLF